MLGRFFLLGATLAIFHAAFSTYQHLSHLKALERPEGPIPHDIVIEISIALFLGILGACLNTSPFKEITWSSEMKQHNIDEMDSRLGFASYVNRGRQFFPQASALKGPVQ